MTATLASQRDASPRRKHRQERPGPSLPGPGHDRDVTSPGAMPAETQNPQAALAPQDGIPPGVPPPLVPHDRSSMPKLVEYPRFSGSTSSDHQDFIRKLDRLILLYRIPDYLVLIKLAEIFTGTALTWYTARVRENPPLTSWEGWRAAIIKQFETTAWRKAQSQRFHALMFTASDRDNAAKWIYDFALLARVVHPQADPTFIQSLVYQHVDPTLGHDLHNRFDRVSNALPMTEYALIFEEIAQRLYPRQDLMIPRFQSQSSDTSTLTRRSLASRNKRSHSTASDYESYYSRQSDNFEQSHYSKQFHYSSHDDSSENGTHQSNEQDDPYQFSESSQPGSMSPVEDELYESRQTHDSEPDYDPQHLSDSLLAAQYSEEMS